MSNQDVDPNMAGFGGGNTAPAPQLAQAIPSQSGEHAPGPIAQPESPPEWGQSFGQDVQNVGGVIGSAVQNVGGYTTNNGTWGGQTPNSGNNTAPISVPKIINYFSGGGGMPPDQWNKLMSDVDPNDSMSQNEKTMRGIEAAQQQSPELGAAAIQHARTEYNLYNAGTAKALAEGNIPLAVHQWNTAQQYMPTGETSTLTADKDGNLKLGVHSMNGQSQNFTLKPDQLNNMVRGPHSLFDHMLERGTAAVATTVSQIGGLPIQSPSYANGPGPNIPNQPAPKQYPGNQPPVNPDVAPGGSPEPVDAGAPTTRQVMGPPSNTTPSAQTPSTRPGDESPINIVRFGQVSQEGNAARSPGDQDADVQRARMIFPNNPAKQAQYLGQQQQQAAERQNKIEIAKNQRLYGSQAAGQARVGAANVAGQARISAADIAAQAKEYSAKHPEISPQVFQSRMKNFDTWMNNQAKQNVPVTEDSQNKYLKSIGLNPTDVFGPTHQEQQGDQSQALPENTTVSHLGQIHDKRTGSLIQVNAKGQLVVQQPDGSFAPWSQ